MKPLNKLFLAAILAFLICQVTYLIFKKGYNSFNIHKTERLAEIFLHSTAYDILFIGSSRTHTTIEPKIIDSVLHVNSYNGGVEGGNLYEFNLTLNGYLINHPAPKVLFLTLDLLSFDLKRKFFNYTQYYPYVKNKAVTDALVINGHRTGFLQILPFLELTAYDDYTRNNIIKGLLGKTEIASGDYQYKGYLSNTEVSIVTDTSVVLPNKRLEISKEGLSLLEDIITTCKKSDIKLIFTYAPEYRSMLQDGFYNKTVFFNKVDSTATKNQIPFLRHDQLAMCQNPQLFANFGHVNKKGALYYSRILAKELQLLNLWIPK